MDNLAIMSQLAPIIVVVTLIAVGGWVLTIWMRIKHGYPLDGAWGQAIYPQKNEETVERVKLLSSENAQLRAELGSIKDRLATVERIVTDASDARDPEADRLRDEVRILKERVAVLERLATDDSSALDREIERLRDKA